MIYNSTALQVKCNFDRLICYLDRNQMTENVFGICVNKRDRYTNVCKTAMRFQRGFRPDDSRQNVHFLSEHVLLTVGVAARARQPTRMYHITDSMNTNMRLSYIPACTADTEDLTHATCHAQIRPL